NRSVHQMAKQTAAEDTTNVTYQFTGEDHTLGNALRYMLMKDPDVEFAGYTVPHPSEPQMNVRVQVHPGTTTDAAVERALDNISAVCDHVLKTYKKAVTAHENKS
ncbi:RPC19, partial [Symbiodinium pilosum]